MISLSELEKLDKNFYMNSALFVAKNLLGKFLLKNIGDRYAGGMIVETEAYMGEQDDAAHSYKLKRTKRNEAMYEEGGNTYIYMIYGMHYCLNVVTNKKDRPEAVLIRAIQPLFGIEIMQQNRKTDIKNLTNGPAKLCKALNIDLKFNKKSLTSNDFFIAKDKKEPYLDIVATKRVNIDYAKQCKDKLWRFIIKNNPFVSV